MKYGHIVKLNGVYYQAGEDVPGNIFEGTAVKETLPPYSDEDIVLETKDDTPKQYSKTDINTMKIADLQNLAASVGIDGAEEMTGGELKKRLIDYYGL